MKTFVIAAAAAALTVIGVLASAPAVSSSMAAQQSSPSPISPSPTAEARPSVEFCQSAMNDAFANGTKILAQLNENEDSAKLAGDPKNVQTVVCMIYFKGVMDGIALTDPKV